jgi:hypothetical protein
VPTGGELAVRRYAPTPAALAAAGLAPDRLRWWQDRLAHVAAVLDGPPR